MTGVTDLIGPQNIYPTPSGRIMLCRARLTMTFDAVGQLHQHSSNLPCRLRGQPSAELRLGRGCLDADPYLFVVVGHLYVEILRHE